MKLDRNSYETIIGVLAAGGVAVWVILRFVHNPWIAIPAGMVAIWFTLFVIYFFRVPSRSRNGSADTVSSVADGVVSFIGRENETEYLHRECLKVSVYMNFYDVHANFWPVDGEVTYHRHHPGKHVLATKPKASEENEHSSTCIRTADGKEVFFKQIAGGFARRIVCYATPGLKVRAGEQCGIIKFGSRVDIYMPLDADVKVSLRQVTRACETVVAKL
jgi:phosphatidylserine decarboxylase